MWLKAASGLFILFLSPCLAVRMEEPPAPPATSLNEPVEGFVDVKLNHFIPYDNQTFKMRYFYNKENAGLNIVIVVGGEWPISPGYTTGGFGYDLSILLRAAVFYTEHRFYGKSRPFEDTSVQGLRFLTVDQALADLAQFIEYVKSVNFEYGRYSAAKVALVGCSYGGSIATWMRVAYPHLVDAVFSDSGPLYAQENYFEYLEVVANAIRAQGSQECLTSIQQAMERVVALLATQEGPARVSQLFNTCSSIVANSTLDLATFFWYGITETFAELVQSARPGHIPTACAVLTNTDVPDPVQRLATWIRSRPNTQPCIESSYRNVVEAHTKTSYDSKDVNSKSFFSFLYYQIIKMYNK